MLKGVNMAIVNSTLNNLGGTDIPTVRSIMHAVKEAVHETESCKHNDHGDVSIFLTRVEAKITKLLSAGTTDSITG